jgi:branched-chain amino acid transport system substrate-binding protein
MTSSSLALNRRHMLMGAATALTSAVLPALAADSIKIGFAMSLTGPNAGAGKMSLLALEIWRDETNAKGGLLGRPVQLVFFDDQSNPALVPGIYTKLIDLDKVDLVISAFGTNQIAPAMPVVMQKKMVFMALFGTGVNEPYKYDRYFQILANGPEGSRSLSSGFFETAMTMDPKPTTVALAGEDAEFGQTILAGARENIQKSGLKIVYDRNFPPGTVDYSPVVRGIAAANPDIVFVASYPGASAAIVRSVSELAYKPRMFGGAMIGLSFTSTKVQLGPLLNGIVTNENYVPEPTMKFAGIDDFLKRYQERAQGAGVDPLGYWSPFAYAEMQILSQAVTAVGEIDHGKLADYLHKTAFKTIVGDVKFGPTGEWEKSRILTIQFQNVESRDIGQFRVPGKQVILYPPEFKSGELIQPFSKARAP